jgi:23S rRNA pseudouridine1911/1915/1917 synthase
MRTLSYTVLPTDEGRPLRRVVRGAMGVSQHVFSALKVQGGVRLDGLPARADQRVRAGQVVTLTLVDRETPIPPDPTPVNVVFEDEDLAVVDKPAPLPCQSSPRQEGFALENRMAARRGCAYVFRPVNRLDKGTSGLMVVAGNAHAQMLLSRSLHTGEFVREYLAVVCGNPPAREGVVDAPIGKAPGATIRREVTPDGKPARTHYHVLEQKGGLTLVRLRLETGRTHQIRVHMRHVGCPVLGDFLYGAETAKLPGRFALHSWRLRLRHPMTGEPLAFESAPPPEFGRWRCLEPDPPR